MNGHRLTELVLIRGRDIWGRDAVLQFCDRGHSNKWKFGVADGAVDIDPDHVRSGRRQLVLHNATTGFGMGIAEHILPLRFAGLVAVSISGSRQPPYFGRTLEVWNAVKNHLCDTGISLPLYSVKNPVQWQYPRRREGHRSFVSIDPPSKAGTLKLDITCTFAGIGSERRVFEFPNPALLEEVLAARTLGWPRSLRWPAGVAFRAGWPHFPRIMWAPARDSDQETRRVCRREIVKHRAQDLLGALALLCKDGMFVGDVLSVCGGHASDLNVVTEAFSELVQIA